MNKEELRIVFLGTPDFAVSSLEVVVNNGFTLVGVVTAPDRPAGRGRVLTPSPVKEYALSQNLPVLQPTNLKDHGFIEELGSLKANLQIVVAFRMLPEVVWNMPELGTFNLHASLLPQYRGAAPINWAIINGEKLTGVTTFFLKHEIDTGDIIAAKELEIYPEETAGELHDRLKDLGSELVVETLDMIINETINAIQQPEGNTELREAPKIFKEDCRIDWSSDPVHIHNFVRGLSPYPAAWSELVSPDKNIHNIKVYRSKVVDESALKPGQVDSDGKTYINIGAGNGTIGLTEVQVAGKKRMLVEDFLRGFQLNNDWTLN